ncbi:MAG: ATP-binding cassette domain-containing protein [Hymenobacter sp.]|nr:MAG: ATP-binding cassette domain-containing protein [Hymenobacter sp.]
MAFTFYTRRWREYFKFPKKACAVLTDDNWNDYGFYTLFHLKVYDAAGNEHEIGHVKIGRISAEKNFSITRLPGEPFTKLDDSYCSLGQDPAYYTNLNKLGEQIRDTILTALRDIAADPQIFELASDEEMTKVSLLRYVSPVTVEGQFRRMTRGEILLTDYNFSYLIPPDDHNANTAPINLSFAVHSLSNPPTNIHVLVGPNGVGKSSLLQGMAHSLTTGQLTSSHARSNQPRTQRGLFQVYEYTSDAATFASLVSVSFSAFDDFEPVRQKPEVSDSIRYDYIGLKRVSTNQYSMRPKSATMLGDEFADSVLACLFSSKVQTWRKVLEILSSDMLFDQADIPSLIKLKEKLTTEGQVVDKELSSEEGKKIRDQIGRAAASLFRTLSSGHKIVLLSITRLVETVQERTLVLIDEPEAHLHPPLLSAFVRALSELLINRNGVAIIATHSPVVVQEVPAKCVWITDRIGEEISAERPERETFGENTGVLTREVFGLSVRESGFHRLIRDAVNKFHSYDSVIQHFNGELGDEAKAIARALSSLKTRG